MLDVGSGIGSKTVPLTPFLLSDETRSTSPTGRLTSHSLTSAGTAGSRTRTTPERPSPYDERFVRALCAELGLEVREPILLGAWCGRAAPCGNRYGNYQDIIVAAGTERRETAAEPGSATGGR